jgi:ATP-dependent Lhr-like helicase
MDPANPYGALVPWPGVADADKAKPRRVAGAWLLLARGRPVLYVGRRGRSLITFPGSIRDEDGALDAAIAALRALPRGDRHRMLVIETIDGVDAKDSPLSGRFHAAGFAADYRGLIDVDVPGRAHGKAS